MQLFYVEYLLVTEKKLRGRRCCPVMINSALMPGRAVHRERVKVELINTSVCSLDKYTFNNS